MIDKKKITSIIKTLERTVGILENCKDTGEMSEATQRRIIELLNSSMLDLYFVKGAGVGHEEEQMEEFGGKIVAADKPKPEVEKFIVSDEEIHLASDVHEEPTVSGLHEIAEELEHRSEQPESEETQPEQFLAELPEIEPSPAEQVENYPQPEYRSHPEYRPEPVQNEPLHRSDISVIEWDVTSEQIVEEQEEAPEIIEERRILEDLRKQLEEERKRLEQELQNWQLEKMKREEEMLASQRLLASLAEEEKRRKALLEKQTAESSAKQAASAEISRSMPTQEPVPSIEYTQSQKKALNEQFGNDELKMQGITPIADLNKAIAINEKFQFIKELFGGDFDRYAETVKALNNAGGLVAAISYIDANFDWDKNNEATRRMIMLVRRRFM